MRSPIKRNDSGGMDHLHLDHDESRTLHDAEMVVVAARQPRHTAEGDTPLGQLTVLRVVGARASTIHAALRPVLSLRITPNRRCGSAEPSACRRPLGESLLGLGREAWHSSIRWIDDE